MIKIISSKHRVTWKIRNIRTMIVWAMTMALWFTLSAISALFQKKQTYVVRMNLSRAYTMRELTSRIDLSQSYLRRGKLIHMVLSVPCVLWTGAVQHEGQRARCNCIRHDPDYEHGYHPYILLAISALDTSSQRERLIYHCSFQLRKLPQSNPVEQWT